MMLQINDELRYELKAPLGELMDFDSFLAKYPDKRIISVGDVVSISLIKKGIIPFLAIYDFRTMRSEISQIEKNMLRKAFPYAFKVKNPAGTVTAELINAISNAMEKGGAIEVQGEEDLSALIVMLHQMENSILIYGQPEKGVVCVKLDKNSKKKAEKILKRMEKA